MPTNSVKPLLKVPIDEQPAATARGAPVPCQLVPALAGWADLDRREMAADIGSRHPILIDPESRIDPVLARFLAWSRFAWLAEGTREAYAKDYRLFFSFLWQRGKYWHEADPDDLLDWEAWRRRAQQPGRRISGSKWQGELAALRLLYEWAENKQHITRSPVLVHQVRLRDGSTVMAADRAPRDVRCADVKWVTPRVVAHKRRLTPLLAIASHMRAISPGCFPSSTAEALIWCPLSPGSMAQERR